MTLKSILFPILFIFILLSPGFGQTKIVINDQQNYLNDQIDSILVSKFAKSDLNYTFSVNMKSPCDYYYVDLSNKEGNKYVSVKNCKTELLGGSKLLASSDAFDDYDYASMLYFKILNIIQNPFEVVEKKIIVIEKEVITEEEAVAEESAEVEEVVIEQNSDNVEIDPFNNQHNSRYFFSPSSYNLKKGELYYNTLYFALHDLQYGVTDNFSMGMGISVAGMPFYITPKLSFPVNEKNHFAIGDMLMIGTYGVDFVANLAYGTYTYGTPSNNITFGLGYFSSNEGDLFNQKFNNPVLSLATMAQLSPFMYFISENYFIHYKVDYTATYDDRNWDYTTNPPTVTGITYQEDFTLSNNLFIGFTGFRFINKIKDVISWQIGLAYFSNNREGLSQQYKQDYWLVNNYTDFNQLIMIPSISYTHKFGKKY